VRGREEARLGWLLLGLAAAVGLAGPRQREKERKGEAGQFPKRAKRERRKGEEEKRTFPELLRNLRSFGEIQMGLKTN